VASTATAAAAALTRYIGVILPLSNAAALVCGSGPHAVRLRRAGVALIACMPLMLWLARNLAVSGTVAGDRFPAAASWDENTRAAVESVLRWLVPADLAMRWRALLALSVGAAVATACVASACRHGAARGAMARTLPFATFALLYLAYLIAAASITALDPIDDRLIAPLLPPLAVIAVVTAHAGGHLQGRVGRFVAPVVMALAILWLFGSGIQMARLLQRIEADGTGGYTSGRWHESEALAALRQTGPAATLYSNDPFAVRYWTGRAARLSPRRYPYRSPETAIDDLPALREALASGAPVELLWFDDVPRDFLLSLEDLRLMLELEPVIQADDGTVYRVIGVR